MSRECWDEGKEAQTGDGAPASSAKTGAEAADAPHGARHGPGAWGWRGPHGDAGQWGAGPPWRGLRGEHHPTRRAFVRRFLAVVLFVLMLIGAWTAGLAFVFTRLLGGGGASTWLVWGGGMALVVALPIVAMTMAARVFRSYALPLADIIDAAETVADGDFGVRVTARGSRDFQRLARSFNHMTEELARSDQQRRNLTADVAHELRTPLHIIRGNLEGVLDGVYAPTAEHIEATLQETRVLARLVDDLRTLSLAEAGELPLTCEPVDVGDLLADVVTSFSAQAEAAGIDLVAVEKGTPLTIQADAGRLDQVLSNLVGNALRHTRAGGRITLDATRADGRVALRVVDTGEGIPPEDLPFVFDRFWRGDRARTHSSTTGSTSGAGGASSGLGLAIAAQLVRAHGGTIAVQSEVGRGTAFVVDLPVGAEGNDPRS